MCFLCAVVSKALKSIVFLYLYCIKFKIVILFDLLNKKNQYKTYTADKV